MKDLDKTQVYDLRGITEEQAKELCERLRGYNRGWGDWGYESLMEDDSLEYFYPEWKLSDRKPTTHISTLFEKSYEQQLQEAKKKLEHYKREVERLENESKPKVGDVVKAWDIGSGYYSIGFIEHIQDYGYLLSDGMYWDNAKKLTEKEVIDLLFKNHEHNRTKDR